MLTLGYLDQYGTILVLNLFIAAFPHARETQKNIFQNTGASKLKKKGSRHKIILMLMWLF